MRTVGRQGMRHPSAMGGVCNVFRPGAAAHGWHALTFPLAPFRSHTGSGRGDVEGWRESLLARARNGRICPVRASCNIRVFDQALILVKQNGGSARGQHSLLWFTDAPAWVRGPLARWCGEWLEPIGKRSAP